MITPQRLLASMVRTGSMALLFFTAFGASPDLALAQPHIQIVGGDTVDWGRIATDTLKHRIQIVNVGTELLRITDVRPSCGCTTTTPLSKSELNPNDTAIVEIAINVKGHTGQQRKTVSIVSNDPDPARSTIAMSFTADLIQDVTASATIFDMIRDAKIGGDYTSKVVLTNTSDGPLTIHPPTVTTPNGDLAVSFELKKPATLKPGETLDLVAHVKPKKAGMYTTDVSVKTSGKHTPDLDLKLITAAVADDPAQGAGASSGN